MRRTEYEFVEKTEVVRAASRGALQRARQEGIRSATFVAAEPMKGGYMRVRLRGIDPYIGAGGHP